MNGITPWHQSFWDWRAAGNFIGGGTGTGLLLTTAILGFFGAPLMPLTLLALAFVACGLFMVFLELGRPLRSMNVLLNAKSSWMSREALVAAPLFLLGLTAAWLEQPLVTLLAALTGVGFLYCQGRILMATKGIPTWRTPSIMPLLLATGLSEGVGACLIALLLLGTEPPLLQGAAVGLLAALVCRFFAWQRYWQSIHNNAPTAALKVLSAVRQPFLVGGHLLPALLALTALLLSDFAASLTALAALAALLAGWLFKFTLITKAAYTQGYELKHAPSRGAGTAGPGAKPGWS